MSGYASPTWVDVPPGTVPPVGAPQLDAAYLQLLTDALAAIASVKPPTGVAATDTANRDAAIAALPASGGQVLFLPGNYALNSALPNTNHVTYRGYGAAGATTLTFSTSMLAPSADIADLHFVNLNIVGTSANHLIELGTTGGLYLSRFLDCQVTVSHANASIVHQNGSGDYDQVWWERCNLFRSGSATVAAFDITSTAGACNGNKWVSCRANSANATSTPFWLIQSSAGGTYAYDNVWRDIIGEQNRGGMIHCYSNMNPVIDHVTDYDATGNYMLDFIRIDKHATGAFPVGGRVTNCGPRGSAMQAGTYHLNVAASTGDFFYAGIHDALFVSKVNIPARGRTGIGRSGALNRGWNAQTVSYSLDTADNIVYSNGSSLTMTLLDPTTVEVGAECTVKNINASPCTVVSAGSSKTIDGVASQTLPKWAQQTYKSDGTQWLIISQGGSFLDSLNLFIPPERMHIYGGTPVLGVNDIVSGWTMANSADSTIAFSASLPSDWNTCTFDILWANNGAGSGNVYWQTFWTPVIVGTAIASNTTTFQIVAAGAQNVPVLTAWVSGGITVPASKVLGFLLQRHGTVGTDTLGNGAILLGVYLRKLS